MRIGAVSVPPKGAKGKNVGFKRMRGEDGQHFKPFDIVPLVEDEVLDVEKFAEQLLVQVQQSCEFFGHRGAHQGGGEIPDASPGAHQGGESGEMVVVGMGVKNAVHLVDPYSQRSHGIGKQRAGIDQVDLPLIGDDARHGRTFGVPAVAFARMNDGKVFRFESAKTEGIGGGVGRAGGKVQVDHHRLAVRGDFENVGAQSAQLHAGGNFHRPVPDDACVEEIGGGTNAAESELQLEAHDLYGLLLGHAGLDDFLKRNQPVVAAIDIVQLRLDLIGRSDQHRFALGVVRMPGDHHPLFVEHVQNRELGKIGEFAVLQGKIRKQDGVRTGFERGTLHFLWQDQSALGQVLDRIGGGAAENPQVRLGHLHPMDSGRNVNLVNSHGKLR